MRSVAVSLALVACAGCGSLLETKLPANSSYVLAPAPAASTGVQLFRSVTPEQSRVASEYVLDVSVRDFQAEYANENAAPTAHVTILARLIRVSDRQLVDTFAATAQGRASDNRMTAVAAAFEEAAHKVVLELAQKTAAAIASDAEKVRTAVGEVPSSRP
jgi:hypothetical protein